MFLLDTDHLVIIQRGTEPWYGRLFSRMSGFEPEDFYVSIVSFHEEVNGWNAYLSRARTGEGIVRAYGMFQEILYYFSTLRTLPFDHAAEQGFQSLRKQRVRVGTMDLRIAAIAISRGFTVLTRNLVDFHQVPGLTAEDWTAS